MDRLFVIFCLQWSKQKMEKGEPSWLWFSLFKMKIWWPVDTAFPSHWHISHWSTGKQATPMTNSHLCHQSPRRSNTKSIILLFLFQESMSGNKTQILPNDIIQKSPFFSFCTWDCWDYAAYFWKQITTSYLMETVWHSFYFSDLAGTKIWWAPTTIF